MLFTARRLVLLGGLAVLTLTGQGAAWAHARPHATSPLANARLDSSPAQIEVEYDTAIEPSASPVLVMDAAGAQVATVLEPTTSNRTMVVAPVWELAPGPYTVGWTSLDPTDGHMAQGFYTFVVNGGSVGIITGEAHAQAPAAELLATLAVAPNADGGSLLRVDLENATDVERVRIRLSRPDLGESLLETQLSADGGWILEGNEVALPGNWHAVVIVRRANVFDDAQAGFDFTIDAATGAPAFL
jgi:methionine-rich copper-binding protein CopC